MVQVVRVIEGIELKPDDMVGNRFEAVFQLSNFPIFRSQLMVFKELNRLHPVTL